MLKQTKEEKLCHVDKRLYINTVRGAAILLMLWGHCVQYCSVDEFDFFENSAYRMIYSFHMPLFMLISGYLFFFSTQKRDFKTLIIYRTQAMLQPIVTIQFFAFFLTTGILACKDRDWGTLLNGAWVSTIGSSLLWFLWSVLCLSVVGAVAFCLVKSWWQRCIVLLLGIGFVALFPNAEMHIFMYPYFFGGLLFAKYERQIPKYILRLRYASIVLFPCMLHFFKREHYIYTSGLFGTGDLRRQIQIDLFRWIIGFVGSIFMLTVLEIVFKALEKKPVGYMVRAAAKVGENSLEIYTLSVIFLSKWLPKACQIVVTHAGYNFLTANIHIYNFVYMPLLAVMYAFVLWLLNRFLHRWKIGKIIFGR